MGHVVGHVFLALGVYVYRASKTKYLETVFILTHLAPKLLWILFVLPNRFSPTLRIALSFQNNPVLIHKSGCIVAKFESLTSFFYNLFNQASTAVTPFLEATQSNRMYAVDKITIRVY